VHLALHTPPPHNRKDTTMGNRAVITTTEKKMGVYLHWNGGRDSVEAFLKYCELRKFRSPSHDCYGWARLCQIISNFFNADVLSIGIDTYDRLDTNNWDNGVYVIDGWQIVDRLFFDGEEQYIYNLDEMLHDIDKSQPKEQQLGAYLDAEEIQVSEVQIGDLIYFDTIGGTTEPRKIIGFGTKDHVNGSGYLGRPYTDIYGDAERGYEWNCNNYVPGETCRRVPRG